MKTVVLVLMILVCFNYILKQTCRKTSSVLFSGAVCALFTALAWPYAIEQSRSQIAVWLSDASLMLDVAVVLTLEVALQTAFCILSAHIRTSGKVRPSTLWLYRFLRWFPGILIFPVLFSILVTVIFSMPGTSFRLVAWSLAAAVFAAVSAGTLFLRRMLPEKEVRLELLFLSNVLIAVLGVIATVNGRTAAAGMGEVNLPALGGICALLLAGLAGGLVAYRIKMKRLCGDCARRGQCVDK